MRNDAFSTFPMLRVVFAFIAVTALVVMSGWSALSHAAGAVNEVQTAVTAQSAEGVSELTAELVEAFGQYMAQRIDVRSKEYLAAKGLHDLEVPKAQSVTTFLERRGEPMGIIRINQGEYTQALFVVVIRGEKLLRVSCTRVGTDPVPVTFGPCADKIKETFGYSPFAS